MKLYLFEHCSLCFYARMMAALKGIELQEIVVQEDDLDLMIDLVGRRQIPIFITNDGAILTDTMQILDHIEAIGPPVLLADERPEMAALAEEMLIHTPPLTMPRYHLLGLPEFGSPAAVDHYVKRKQALMGDFSELLSRTPVLTKNLQDCLARLDVLIGTPNAINVALSKDDIRILSLLRSAAVVDGLAFPERVQTYFETMMNRIGFLPLPKI